MCGNIGGPEQALHPRSAFISMPAVAHLNVPALYFFTRAKWLDAETAFNPGVSFSSSFIHYSGL
jgi:hypothetical protein